MINQILLHLAAAPMTILCVIHTALTSPVTSSLTDRLAAVEDSAVSPDFKFSSSASRVTFTLTGSERERFEETQPLIEALKQLSILESKSDCATVEIISQESEAKQELRSRLTKLTLYIRQYDPLPQTASLRVSSDLHTGHASVNNRSSVSGLHHNAHRNIEHKHKRPVDAIICVPDSNLKSVNVNDRTLLDGDTDENTADRRANDTDLFNQTSQGNSTNESSLLEYDIPIPRSSIARDDHNDDDDDDDDDLAEQIGLNKRQVLVISTCSTIIGLFFIVALVLRIRNYIKRSRMEKEGLRRHMSRSISITRRIQSNRTPTDTPVNPAQSRLVRST